MHIYCYSINSKFNGKFAVEIRNLQKTETREVEEAFAKVKGSSAMPQNINQF